MSKLASLTLLTLVRGRIPNCNFILTSQQFWHGGSTGVSTLVDLIAISSQPVMAGGLSWCANFVNCNFVISSQQIMAGVANDN